MTLVFAGLAAVFAFFAGRPPVQIAVSDDCQQHLVRLTFALRGLLLAVAVLFLIPIIHTIILIPSSIVILDKIILCEPVSDNLLVLILGHRIIDLCLLRLSRDVDQPQLSSASRERTLYCLRREAPPRAALSAANLSALLSPDLLELIVGLWKEQPL